MAQYQPFLQEKALLAHKGACITADNLSPLLPSGPSPDPYSLQSAT